MRGVGVALSFSSALVLVGSASTRARAHGDADSAEAKPASRAENDDAGRTGFILRLYGQGLAGYYGEAFYAGTDGAVIPEAAFGFGALLGVEFDSRLSFGIWGEWLFGGVDTDALADVDGFRAPEANRGSVGASVRVSLFDAVGLRPYLGVDGQYMLQMVQATSEGGERVPVRSRRTGRLLGFTTVPDAELEAQHSGWGVGPVFGLRAKLTRRNLPHVDLFAEAAVVHEWWTADGVQGFARSDVEAARVAADVLDSTQLEPTSWTTTVRVGLQFGP